MSDEKAAGGQSELIAGIERETAEEIERLKKETAKSLAERREATRRQIEGIRAEAERRAEEQARIIRKEAQAQGAVETHRIELRARDEVFAGVLARVRARLAALIDRPDYGEILTAWIVEAAIGLGEARASVNASGRERLLLPAVLKEAERKAAEITGRAVSLSESSDPPLSGQGVVLTSVASRTAFNNQVETRLLRFHTEIQRMIYEALQAEEGSRSSSR